MNYLAIGQRVRSTRRAQGLSQEILAEKIGISVTHMSHIETGSTKLSLPVLAAIAQTLNISADTLLFGERTLGQTEVTHQLQSLLSDCDPASAHFLLSLTKEAKNLTQHYLRK